MVGQRRGLMLGETELWGNMSHQLRGDVDQWQEGRGLRGAELRGLKGAELRADIDQWQTVKIIKWEDQENQGRSQGHREVSLREML